MTEHLHGAYSHLGRTEGCHMALGWNDNNSSISAKGGRLSADSHLGRAMDVTWLWDGMITTPLEVPKVEFKVIDECGPVPRIRSNLGTWAVGKADDNSCNSTFQVVQVSIQSIGPPEKIGAGSRKKKRTDWVQLKPSEAHLRFHPCRCHLSDVFPLAILPFIPLAVPVFIPASLSLLFLEFIRKRSLLKVCDSMCWKRKCLQKVENVEEMEGLSILDLPELALEGILSRLSPASLCNMAGVCTDLRERCRSNHLWEPHLKAKWGKVVGPAAYREWQWTVAMNKDTGVLNGGKSKVWLWSLSCIWPFSWLKLQQETNRKTTSGPPIDSVMAWYLALESGNFWFPAQVYNREHGHVGFMLSCYDAELSYDCQTDTFHARYPPHGPRTIVMEEGVQWERLRAPPVDTPAHDLHASDCLNDLRPGDHVEIQWRRNKEFPYGKYYIQSFRQFLSSDMVLLPKWCMNKASLQNKFSFTSASYSPQDGGMESWATQIHVTETIATASVVLLCLFPTTAAQASNSDYTAGHHSLPLDLWLCDCPVALEHERHRWDRKEASVRGLILQAKSTYAMLSEIQLSNLVSMLKFFLGYLPYCSGGEWIFKCSAQVIDLTHKPEEVGRNWFAFLLRNSEAALLCLGSRVMTYALVQIYQGILIKHLLSDVVMLEFNQYTPGSRWRRAAINRKDHREEGNEAEGFYGGIRKLQTKEEILTWKRLWPNETLE
eukprot:Gb_33621 [translate_table: standard]